MKLVALVVVALVGCGSVNALTVDGGDGAAGASSGGAAGGRGGAELGGRGGGAAGAAGASSGGAAGGRDGGADARASCGTDVIAYAFACGTSVDGFACVMGCTVADGTARAVDGCTFGARYCLPAGASCADGCH